MLFRAALVAALLTPAIARADLRSFTHTYEYATTPEGKTSVELWHTQGRTTWDKTSPQFYEQIVEVEHGLTDHWDIAFYTVFAEATGDASATGTATGARPFGLDSTRLETRYRLADRGEWPVDTLLYLELAKDFGKSVYELEGKVIVAHDFDKITVAANAIAEAEVGRDVGETEAELGWAAGATYQLHPKVKLGAETWGSYEEDETYLSAGPALNLAPTGSFWVTMTAGFGITDEADAFSARAIVGIEL